MTRGLCKGTKEGPQHYVGTIGGIIGEKMRLEGQNGVKICNFEAQNCCFFPKRAILTHGNLNETQYNCFLLELGSLEPKNITFTHIIMILAILAPFSLLWQIGFSKMVTMSLFYDPGPPKRYQWGLNTWVNIIWGQLGGNFVKNRGLKG